MQPLIKYLYDGFQSDANTVAEFVKNPKKAITEVIFPAPHRYSVPSADMVNVRETLKNSHRDDVAAIDAQIPPVELGVTLHGIRVTSSPATKDVTALVIQEEVQDKEADQIVFSLMGNAECWESRVKVKVPSLPAACAKKGFQVVEYLYNPRGVGNSTGTIKKTQDFVDDYYNLIKNHIDQKLDGSENAYKVTINGHSLGAGYGAIVAARLHADGYKVNYINGRSFSTLGKAMLGDFQGLGHITDPYLKAIGWDIDALAAWKKIPDAYKTYLVAKKDGVITARGSLHYALRKERKAQEQLFEQFMQDIETVQGCFQNLGTLEQCIYGQRPVADMPKEEKAAIARLKHNYKQFADWDDLLIGDKYAQPLGFLKGKTAILTRLREMKAEKFDAHVLTEGKHSISLNRAKNRYDEDGQACLLRFMKRCTAYHKRQQRKAEFEKEHRVLMNNVKEKDNMLSEYQTGFAKLKQTYQTKESVQAVQTLQEGTDGLREKFNDFERSEKVSTEAQNNLSEAEESFLWTILKPHVLGMKDQGFSYIDFRKIIWDQYIQRFALPPEEVLSEYPGYNIFVAARKIVTHLRCKKESYLDVRGASLDAHVNYLPDSFFKEYQHKDERALEIALQQQRLKQFIQDIAGSHPDLQLIFLMAITNGDLLERLQVQKSGNESVDQVTLNEIKKLGEIYRHYILNLPKDSKERFDEIIAQRLDVLCANNENRAVLRELFEWEDVADNAVNASIQAGLQSDTTASAIKKRTNKVLSQQNKQLKRLCKKVRQAVKKNSEERTLQEAAQRQKESEGLQGNGMETRIVLGEEETEGEEEDSVQQPLLLQQADRKVNLAEGVIGKYLNVAEDYPEALKAHTEHDRDQAVGWENKQAKSQVDELANRIASDSTDAIDGIIHTHKTPSRIKTAVEKLKRVKRTEYHRELAQMQQQVPLYRRTQLQDSLAVKAGENSVLTQIDEIFSRCKEREKNAVVWVLAELDVVEKRINRMKIVMWIGSGLWPLEILALCFKTSLGQLFYPKTFRVLEQAKELTTLVEKNEKRKDGEAPELPTSLQKSLAAFTTAIEEAKTRDDFNEAEWGCWYAQEEYCTKLNGIRDRIDQLGPPVLDSDRKKELEAQLKFFGTQKIIRAFQQRFSEIKEHKNYKKLDEYHRTPPHDRYTKQRSIFPARKPLPSKEQCKTVRDELCAILKINPPAYADTPILGGCQKYYYDDQKSAEELMTLYKAMAQYDTRLFTKYDSGGRFKHWTDKVLVKACAKFQQRYGDCCEDAEQLRRLYDEMQKYDPDSFIDNEDMSKLKFRTLRHQVENQLYRLTQKAGTQSAVDPAIDQTSSSLTPEETRRQSMKKREFLRNENEVPDHKGDTQSSLQEDDFELQPPKQRILGNDLERTNSIK